MISTKCQSEKIVTIISQKMNASFPFTTEQYLMNNINMQHKMYLLQYLQRIIKKL